MATVDVSLVRSAVKKHRKHVIENQEVLTMKQFRKILEEDLQLEPASLKPHKELIEEMVDQMVSANRAKEAKAQKQPEEKKAKSEKKSKGEGGSSSGKKSKRKEESSDPPRKKRKQEKEEPAKKASSGPREDSKVVKKAKNICKQAGIKIPPNIYRNKDESDLQEAFSSLLEKHDLSLHASSSDIARAAKKLQKEKDLEGIDASNIVEGGRRSRPQVNYNAVLKPKYLETIESGSEADSEEGEESSEEESGSEASDEENVRPKNGKGEIRSGKKQKKRTVKADSGASESEDEGYEEKEEDSASPDSPSQQDMDDNEGDGPDGEVGTKKGSSKAKDADEPSEDDSDGGSEAAEGSDDDTAMKGKAKSVKRPASADAPSSRGQPHRGPKASTPSESVGKGDESDGARSEEEEAPKSRRAMAAWSDDD